jgi:hypothetical protein
VPVYEWVFDKLGKEIEIELRNFAKRTDFFDVDTIEEYLKRPGSQLWYLYNFALWHRKYIEQIP